MPKTNWRDVLHVMRVYVIICDWCGENIVERADERDLTSRKDADKYAREHWEKEHAQDAE